jgi:NitT/TauT family transport system substrate-binding protein
MKRATFASIAAAACAAPTIVRGQTLPTVRVGTFPSESYGLAIYAKEQGFFLRNGINADVQYIATASGGITAALVGGALEVGCISMGPTSNAHLRGIPIRLIAPGGIILSEQATTALVVAKNGPINSAKDLNGKTVATVVLRDVIHVAQAKWIDMNGGDSKTVKFVELNMPESPGALTSGRIDAVALAEPILTNTKDDFKQLGHIYDAISKRLMISMHIAMADWLDKNADTARRVVVAMRQAAQWANANKPAANAIVARETKIPLEVVNKMNHVVYGETLDLATIQPQIDALFEYKFIERKYNVADIIWSGARSA